MEQAVDKCQAGDDDRVQSWDEAVALYVGSMAKVTNGNDGNFLYTNAKKRCRNFGTCEGRNGARGEAKANAEILEQFTLAQRHVFIGECEEARLAKNRISDLMAVPLIQGTIRFAYLMGKEGIIDSRSDVTSATFAASILPLVQSCSPVDAQIVYSNMRVGATSVRFSDVKSALDRNLRCMGLTCANIGGLVSDDGFMEGAEPCDDFTIIFNEATPEIMSNATVGIAVPTQATAAPTQATVAPTKTPTTAPTVQPTETATTATTLQPSTIAPANLTHAPSTEAEQFAANATGTSNTTAPPLQTLDPFSDKCPPCGSTLTSNAVATSKSLGECPTLLEAHWDLLNGEDCDCACFVDSKFAFCAQETITYTGSGSLVGPCEVELKGSLIEEDTAEVSGDLVEATIKPTQSVEDYPPLSSSNTTETDTLVGNTTGEEVVEEVEEATTTAPTANLQDFNIAAAERQSSATVILLSGFILFVTLVPTVMLL